MIVAAELIRGANERDRLEPMTKAAEAELAKAGVEAKPELVLADAGYYNGPQIDALEADGTSGSSARPTPTAERRRRRCARDRTSRRCEDGSKSPRPRRPTGEDSRWSSRSSPRSNETESGRFTVGGYPLAAPSGV